MVIDAVIFDMDGLMLDTEPLYRQMAMLAAADCGVELSHERWTAFLGRRSQDCNALLHGWFGNEFPVTQFWDCCRHHSRNLIDGRPIPLKRGLLELLDVLDEQAIRTAVATSTRAVRAREYLTRTGLIERFAVIVTGDQVVNGKPAPDLFLLAAERLGVPPAACLVLEDAETGILAAHAAGMSVCAVPDMQHPSPEVARLATKVCESLVEVIAFIHETRGGAA